MQSNISFSRCDIIQKSLKNQINPILEFLSQIFSSPPSFKHLKAAVSTFQSLLLFFDDDSVLNSPHFEIIMKGFPINSESVILITPVILQVIIVLLQHRFTDHIKNLFSTVSTQLETIIGPNFENISSLNDPSFIESFLKPLGELSHYFHIIPQLDNSFDFILMFVLTMARLQDDEQLYPFFHFWSHILRCLYSSKKEFLFGYFQQLRRFIILHTPMPYEEYDTLDEFGNLIRSMKYSSLIDSPYGSVRQCLVFLMNQNKDDMIEALTERFSAIKSVDDVCTICWSIGATGGVYIPSNSNENDYLITMITELFKICSMQDKSENRIKIAIGIVFVLTENYSYFLKFPPVFQAVMEKLIEFLSSDSSFLKDVVIDTFSIIGARCSSEFNRKLDPEGHTFASQLFDSFPSLIQSLDSLQVIKLLQALINIASQTNEQRDSYYTLFTGFIEQYRSIYPKDNSIGWLKHEKNVQKCFMKLARYFPIEFIKEHDFARDYALFTELTDGLAANIDPSDMNIPLSEILSQNIPNDTKMILSSLAQLRKTIVAIPTITIMCNFDDELLTDLIPMIQELYLTHFVSAPFSLKCVEVVKLASALISKVSLPQFNVPDLVRNIGPIALQLAETKDPKSVRVFCSFITPIFYNHIGDFFSQPLELVKWLFGANKMISVLSPEENEQPFSNLNTIWSLGNYVENDSKSQEFIEFASMETLEFAFSSLLDFNYKKQWFWIYHLIETIFQQNKSSNLIEKVLHILCQILPQQNPNNLLELIKSFIESEGSFRQKLRDFQISVLQITPSDFSLTVADKEEMEQAILKQLRETIPGFISPREDIEFDTPQLANAVSLISLKKE